MVEYKPGDDGYDHYINGRDAFVEFITQKQAKDVDFLLGVIDEIVSWLNETKVYYEED